MISCNCAEGLEFDGINCAEAFDEQFYHISFGIGIAVVLAFLLVPIMTILARKKYARKM